MSRKSKHEEDFESMEIEEIQSHIEQAEAAMEEKRRAIAKINAKKNMTDNAKKKETQVPKEEVELLKQRIVMLYRIKDFKIPFYEKLPKDNQFYKHLMQNLNFNRMKDAAD